MVEKEDDDFEIEIEKSGDTTRIRISGVKKSRFDKAYRLVTHLALRTEELNSEIEEERRLNSMNMQVDHLWTAEGNTWKLDKSISDLSYRVALSLLRTHPECRKQVEVINETGVAKMTVSDNLCGKVKSTCNYFEKCNNGYRLSDDGLRWVSDKIIPSASSTLNETKQEGE